MGPYTPVIIASLLGFLLLAFLLLAPIYRFLRKEEEASREWTDETLSRREHDEPPSRNGTR